jgi:hypothetical protein
MKTTLSHHAHTYLDTNCTVIMADVPVYVRKQRVFYVPQAKKITMGARLVYLVSNYKKNTLSLKAVRQQSVYA